MFDLARKHLTRLGLLGQRYKVPRKNETPEFDKETGLLKAGGYELTPLGRLFLARIGVAQPGEF